LCSKTDDSTLKTDECGRCIPLPKAEPGEFVLGTYIAKNSLGMEQGETKMIDSGPFGTVGRERDDHLFEALKSLSEVRT